MATGAALVAIILAVGPVSGGHLNPVITLLDRTFGGMRTRDAVTYIGAQVAGGVMGAIVANLMFGLPAVTVATTSRTGGGVWFSEVIATLGLALVVFGVVRSGRPGLAPFAVGSYIGAAYFFTSSTSFANPAVTLARTLSNTFAGIRPVDAIVFVGFQLVGAVAAALLIVLLYPTRAGVPIDLVEPADLRTPEHVGEPTHPLEERT
jgi:arsenate reductase